MTFYLDKTSSSTAPVRYAIRQVLDQELKKEKLLANSVARHARSSIYPEDIAAADEDKENRNPVEKAKEAMAKAPLTKRDFFGRIVNDVRPRSKGNGAIDLTKVGKDDKRVWVSFHEGFSNAVRKPITLKELMDSF
jgi:chromosome transmission fidelity protein 18